MYNVQYYSYFSQISSTLKFSINNGSCTVRVLFMKREEKGMEKIALTKAGDFQKIFHSMYGLGSNIYIF